MNLSIVTKMVLGAGASVAVSGIIVMAIKLSHKPEFKTITKLLSDSHPEKRLLYDNYKGEGGGSSEWRAAWKSYKNKYSAEEFDPFNVLDGKSLREGEEAPADFMESCKNLFDAEVAGEEDDKYKLVFNYCTRTTLVSDWVWGRGHEMASQGQGQDTSIWKDLWKKYKDSKDNFWNISEFSPYTTGQDAPSSFKNKCASVANIPQGNKNDSSIDKVFLYCSKKRID